MSWETAAPWVMTSAVAQALAAYERERWLRNTAQAERANARPGQASMPPKAHQGEGR